MKKFKNSTLISMSFVLVILCSCSMEESLDVLNLGFEPTALKKLKTQSWSYELNNLLNSNEETFNTLGLHLINYEIDKDESNQRNSIIDSTSLLPIYYRADSIILAPLSWVIDDTLTLHVKANLLFGYVDSLLQNVDYQCIKLSWGYKDQIFSSMALFNKWTGELEYDNILFNLVKYNESSKVFMNSNFRITLSRTEYPQENTAMSGSVVQHRSFFPFETTTATFTWRELGTEATLYHVTNGDTVWYKEYLHAGFDVNYNVTNGNGDFAYIDCTNRTSIKLKFVFWYGSNDVIYAIGYYPGYVREDQSDLSWYGDEYSSPYPRVY